MELRILWEKEKTPDAMALVAASGVYHAYMVVMFISCKMR